MKYSFEQRGWVNDAGRLIFADRDLALMPTKKAEALVALFEKDSLARGGLACGVVDAPACEHCNTRNLAFCYGCGAPQSLDAAPPTE